MEHRFRLNSILKKCRYLSSELRYRYIPISKISRYRQMLLRYLYTISELLCFDIEFRVLRYRCFFVISSLGCLLGTGHRLRCAHCIANQSLPAHAPPGPPQRRLHSAARPHPLHRPQHRPQPPERGSAAGAAAARCRSRQSGHQRNAGARDSWRQKLTGAKFAAAGAAVAAAGAGINRTQERVILGDKN
jgi:hypothetical protein